MPQSLFHALDMPTPVHWLGYCRNRSPHPLSLHSRWGGSVPLKTFSFFFFKLLFFLFSGVWEGERELRTCFMEETCGQRVPARWVKLPSYLKKKLGEIMTRLGTNLYQIHYTYYRFPLLYFQQSGINHLIPQNGARPLDQKYKTCMAPGFETPTSFSDQVALVFFSW